MEKTFQTRQTQKTDTSTNWSNNNPVLLNGEIAFEVTNSNVRMKVGDGESTYDDLPVIATTEITSIADVNGLQSALDGKLGTTAQAADSAKLNGQLPAYYLNYNNLSNKPTIPSVGNGTITIKQAGTTKGTFTTNQSGNATIELTDSNTTYSSKSAASGGTDVSLVTTGEKYTWNNKASTSVATQSAAGLMSASDKAKLDGIASGANNYTYTLPSAGTSLGGVKSGGDVTISSGVITVNDDSHNHVISNIDGLQTALDGKAATHSHPYLPLAGGTLDTNATITLNTYGTRKVTLSGNSITADMSSETGGWAGSFAAVKHKSTASDGTVTTPTTTMLGWYGSASDLNHIFMGGTYSDPFMKFTPDGQFTFKKTPKVGSTAVSLSGHTHNYAASSSAGGAATKAVGDGNGNNIVNTYATKTELTTKISELEARLSALEARMNALNLGFVESEDDM